MANFFSLPLEVRQMIYSYVLILGGLMPYQRSHELALTENAWLHAMIARLPDPPITSLLETCRLIHAEASPILYSKNKFYLPLTALTVKFFKYALHNSTRCLWVKSVHLEFLPQDTSVPECCTEEGDLNEVGMFREYKMEYDESGGDEDELYRHKVHKRELRMSAWPRKTDLVLENLALDCLTVDLVDPNCQCGIDFCAMVASSLATFSPGFAHELPSKLRIYGSHFVDPRTVKEAMQCWTEQRKQKFIPLSQGLKENSRFVHEVEMEHCLDLL